MNSPSKRAAGQALPLPGLRGAGTRARADAVRRDALTASNAPAAAAQVGYIELVIVLSTSGFGFWTCVCMLTHEIGQVSGE